MGAVLDIVAGLFALLGLGVLLAWVVSRDRPALLLGAACYLGAAIGAHETRTWWPLVAGLALAWVLRLLGADPGTATGHRGGDRFAVARRLAGRAVAVGGVAALLGLPWTFAQFVGPQLERVAAHAPWWAGLACVAGSWTVVFALVALMGIEAHPASPCRWTNAQ